MKKRRRRRRSPPKVSRYRRVVGRLPHSMVTLAVVTVGLTFGLASVGWAVDGKPLLAGRTNTATQPTVLDKAGAGPALDLRVDSGPALAVSTPDLVTNLNADLLDGKEAAAFAELGHKHSGADITSGTVGESFIDDAITRDSEVPSLVGDSFATQSALNEEKAARQAADTTLQNNIDNETAARQAADTTLQNNINIERQLRLQNETQLRVQLENEKHWAEIRADGTIVRDDGVSSVQNFGPGQYIVTFDRDITRCAHVATLHLDGSFGVISPGEIVVAVQGGPPPTGASPIMHVATFDSTGTSENRAFDLIVLCSI